MNSVSTPFDPAAWRSFHLFYHGDRDRVLLDLVRPAAARLLRQGLADRFYFIRYGLGGPHLRLRFRALPGRGDELAAELGRLAAEYLAAHPSAAALDLGQLASRNAVYLQDSQEDDPAIYPDNTLREFPPTFEIERYGGAELFPAALDFFGISSLEALRCLNENADLAPAGKLSAQLRFLIRQAWGLAAGPEEFVALLHHPLDRWAAALPAVAQKSERVFEQQGEGLRRLLRRELEAAREEASPLAQAAFALSREVASAPAADRHRIGASQLHMSANRLGLRNPDELYLGGLLVRAAEQEAGRDRDRFAACWQPAGYGAELAPLLESVLRVFLRSDI